MDMLGLEMEPPPGGEVLHASDRTRVIWGDSRDPQVIAQVPDWYSLLCTDPPYGIGYESARRIGRWGQIAGDDGTVDWPGVLAEWVGPEGTWNRGLANGAHLYVFGYEPAELAVPLRLGATAELIWRKGKMTSGNLSLPWGTAHEKITFGVHRKPKSDRAKGDGALSARLRTGSVLDYPAVNGRGAKRHPNEKPWKLLADLIESSTVRGDLVVDPCAGSGSTGVAAVLEGRRCFLVEVDRTYAELTVKRVQAAERLVKQMEAL
jgi:site-specific DNA-methyltransferase (adenine-specific)